MSTHLKQDLGCNEGKAVQGGHQNAKTPNPHNPNEPFSKKKIKML